MHCRTESSAGNVMSTAGVVPRVNQAGLVNDQTALTRDDKVDISFHINGLSIFQPEDLQKTKA